MGNRFREKTVEEGLDGDVAREALVGAMRSEPRRKTGNRRRSHEEVRKEEEISNEIRNREVKATGNRRRRHEEEIKVEEDELRIENEELEIKNEQPANADDVENIVVDEVEEEDDTPEVNGIGGRVAKGVAKVLGGDILSDKFVLKQIPLILLCLVFLLLLVANRYQVESLSREKMRVMEKVNELREQQIELQKKNQNSVRISQIRDDLEKEKGLGIMPTPPNVI